MQSEVDFAEGALPQDLADFIQLDPRLWHFVILFEAVRDDLSEEGHLASTWTQ